jgi:hypothetical protein
MLIACKHKTILGVALVAAVSLPAYSAMADSMRDVTSRDTAQVERDFGRASGDSYWQAREPSPVPSVIVDAYTGTKEFLTQPPTTPKGPERYGRAGGFVGMDELHSPAWMQSENSGRSGG